MKKQSMLRLGLALALTVVLLVAVMAVSVFADSTVEVDNQDDFYTALTTAPAGETTTIKITGDFEITRTDAYTAPADATIVITSDDTYSISYNRGSNGYSFLRVTQANTDLTITGNVRLTTTRKHCAVNISGSGAHVTLSGNASIDGFGLTTDNSGGAGVRCFTGSYFTMDGGSIINCTVTGASSSGNRARGCAIYIGSGTVVINDGLIAGNSITTAANYNGGAAVYLNTSTSSCTINGGVIAGNVVTSSTSGASCGGGAIFCNNGASVTINGGRIGGTELADGTPDPTGVKGNCIVKPDGANSIYGGAIFNISGTFTINGGTFSYNNVIRTNAGNEAAAVIRNNSTMIVRETDAANNPLIVENNHCGYYAGIFYSNGYAMDIEGGTFRGNSASGTGGIAWSSTDFTISGGLFENNSASAGGVVNMSGTAKTLTVTGGTFIGNSATTASAGCFSGNAQMVISGGTFTNNSGNGGAVASPTSGGSLTLSGGTFSGNVGGKGAIDAKSGAPLYLSGNVVTDEDDFIYAEFGAEIYKAADFTWSGAMGVMVPEGSSDGNEIILSGDATITAADEDKFTIRPNAFTGYIASLVYDDSGSNSIILRLEEDTAAEPLVKNVTTDTDYFSLATAASEADDGDILEIQVEDLNLSEQVTLTRGVTIRAKEGVDVTVTKTSGGAGNGLFFCNTPSGDTGTYTFSGLTLDAGGNFNRILTTNSGRDTLVISDCTLTGGATYAVVNYGPLTIGAGTDIYGNGSGGSAAVYSGAANAPITMTGGKIHNNTSRGIYAYGGSTLTMTGGEIYNNTVTAASTSGGAIFSGYASGAGAVLNISNAKLYNNVATGNGGAFYSQASVTLDNVEITGNTSGSNGGGAYFGTASSVITITDSKINGNTAASEAGGIACGNVTSVDFTDTEICGNTASSVGGGIEFYGACTANVTFTRVTIAGNTASAGGGIYKGASSTLTFNDCTLGGTALGTNSPDTTGTRGNFARNGSSGFLYSGGGSITLVDSDVKNNACAGAGGAMNVSGSTTLTATGCTFEDNRAVGGASISSYAGAINTGSSSNVSFTNCHFYRNMSRGGGGAAIINGTASFTGTDFKGNLCGTYEEENVFYSNGEGYVGSALYVDNAGRVTLKNVEMTGNGHGLGALYASNAGTNSITLDGDIVIKDNSPSFDYYDNVNGVYTVGAAETANGFAWRLGQNAATTVNFKETLGSATDVLITVINGSSDSSDVFVGKVVDSTGAETTTNITDVLVMFMTSSGAYLTQEISDVKFDGPTVSYTVQSVNNGETKDITCIDFGSGIALPAQADIVDDLTAGTAFEGSYGADNFIGYADVTGYGSAPVLTALYKSGATVETADISGKTLYATWANAKTVPGASIKITADGATSGIRFLTLLETDALAAIGIENVTAAEWDSGDIGYTFGIKITKDYGDAAAKTQTYQSAGGKLFTDTWFGDDLYDASYLDRGTNHVFSFGLNLASTQYEYSFTPTSFLKVQYTDGSTATLNAPIPTEGDPAEPIARTARGVARSYAAWLVSGANPDLGKTNLGLKPAQIAALEAIADGTFDLAGKTYADN